MDAYLSAEVSAAVGSKNLGTFLSNETLQKYSKMVGKYQQIVKTMADVSLRNYYSLFYLIARG